MDIVFTLSNYDREALRESLANALERISELLSRQRYPKLWEAADKRALKHHAFASSEDIQRRQNRKNLIFGIVFIVAGILLLVPGITKPSELLIALIAGAYALIMGVLYLLRAFRKRRPAFLKEADDLLAQLQAILDKAQPGETIQVRFTPHEMIIDNNAPIEYATIVCAAENEDLVVINWEEQVAVLKKSDLTEGSMQALRARLRREVPGAETKLFLWKGDV